jgi:hypothetical protein
VIIMTSCSATDLAIDFTLHHTRGPRKKSWGIEMTLISSFMRGVARHTRLADIVSLVHHGRLRQGTNRTRGRRCSDCSCNLGAWFLPLQMPWSPLSLSGLGRVSYVGCLLRLISLNMVVPNDPKEDMKVQSPENSPANGW